jgi:hypothetical protein
MKNATDFVNNQGVATGKLGGYGDQWFNSNLAEQDGGLQDPLLDTRRRQPPSQWQRPTAILSLWRSRQILLGSDEALGLVGEPRYADTLPSGMRDLLLAYARRDPTRHSELAALMLTPTYETAARCLLRWFNEKFRPPPRR